MLKIAHLSDLHFSKIRLGFKDIFSKRIIGMTNLIFNRKKAYINDHLKKLPDLFKSLGITHVCVSGDLTSTSLDVEFEEAKKFISSFDKKIQFLIVPGNHDKYTKKSCKTLRFYDYFHSKKPKFSKSLKEEKVEVYQLNDSWYYIGLDTCIATPLFSCSGHFSKELENELEKVLNEIPKDKKIIIANHFPINHLASKRKILHRRDNLKILIKKHSNIKLYLYGHTHMWAIDKDEDMPYMICSGCSSHKTTGSFNILEIENHTCNVSSYSLDENFWKKQKELKINFHE
ncbi:MAG: metallophosphoesterase [Parachlamydiales bacterium]|nr:metallophosphoesterase [Parachlamydiales bacterium]